jgi:hypothetical protein
LEVAPRKPAIRSALALAVLVLPLTRATVATSQDKKAEGKPVKGIDFNVELLEKHGVRFKAAKVFEAKGGKQIKLLFEFEKDVEEKDLPAVREAFKTLIPITPNSAPKATLHLFDGDNVVIGIALFTAQEGGNKRGQG